MVQRAFLERAIDQGLGRSAADLVVKNVRLLDVITGAVAETDIAICGDRIVGTHDSYRGRREIDARGRIVVPGFIDTHLHVEMLAGPAVEFERGVLPRGVDDRDLRPARDRQRAGRRRDPLFPGLRRERRA